MNDTVSRKALIDWAYETAEKVETVMPRDDYNDGYISALKVLAFELNKGRFNITESEGEATLRAENEYLKREYEGLFRMYERLRAALENVRAYIKQQVEEHDYGFFPGGDPTRFIPDEEVNTPEEIENWKDACERWNSGDKTGEEGSHRWLTNEDGEIIGTSTVAKLGMGICTYINEEAKAVLDAINKALSTTSKTAVQTGIMNGRNSYE